MRHGTKAGDPKQKIYSGFSEAKGRMYHRQRVMTFPGSISSATRTIFLSLQEYFLARSKAPGAHPIWQMLFMDELIRDGMNKTNITLPMPRDPENREQCDRFVATFADRMAAAYKVRIQEEFWVSPDSF